MKKWFLGIILAIGLISIGAVAPTFAAANSPFNGTFSGIAYGEYNSTAPLTLTVTQEGDDVTANINIDNGLKVNAGGFCGIIAIPASSISASGIDTNDDLNVLTSQVPFDVGGGVTVTAEIIGEMSADGDEMDVEIKVNTPFICGNDPVVTGTLVSVNQ